jgi:hypothetical protein
MRMLWLLIACLIDLSPALGADYNVNLANSDTSWGTVLSEKRLPFVADKGIVSSGPFYIDLNHRTSALLVGPLVVWANGYQPDGDQETPLGRIDLTGTKIKFNLTLQRDGGKGKRDVLTGGKVVFWFQSKLTTTAVAGGDFDMPPRIVNYAYEKNLLPNSLSGTPDEISISPDLNHWSCMGDNPVDTRPMIGSAAKYGCAIDQREFAWAIAHPIDMGFLFFLPPKASDGTSIQWLDPNDPYRTPIMKRITFSLSEFVIERSDSPRKLSTIESDVH